LVDCEFGSDAAQGVADCIERHPDLSIVLLYAGGVAGVCAGYSRNGDWAVLEALIVTPELRGLGVGGELLRRFERAVCKVGLHGIELVCDPETRPFYTHRGFYVRRYLTQCETLGGAPEGSASSYAVLARQLKSGQLPSTSR
jgi:predicted N-acetyltransferase YhbS